MARPFSARSGPCATATSVSACRKARPGSTGAVAEAFNDIVELNQRTAQELRRISRAVGREGRISHRVSIGPAGSWARNEAAVNQLVFDLTEPMLEISRVMDAVARGDLSQRMATGDRWPAAQGRIQATGRHDQHDGRPAERLRERGHARRARGRHRGQARRPGRRPRCRRDLEGPDRFGQLDGRQPDRPGPQHRRRHDRRRQGRPLARRSRSTCSGEILELKDTINTMVDQLNALAAR